jgi:hypothetical protein
MSTCGQRQSKGFLKKLSVKKAGELLSVSRKQLRITKGLRRWHCHLKEHLFKLRLVKKIRCRTDVSRHPKWLYTFLVTVRI